MHFFKKLQALGIIIACIGLAFALPVAIWVSFYQPEMFNKTDGKEVIRGVTKLTVEGHDYYVIENAGIIHSFNCLCKK